MKKLKSLLTNQHLNILHEKITYLTHLNQLWRKIVSPEFTPYTRIANYSDGKLTLIIPHAGWATRIRYETPTLITQLKKYSEFQCLVSISCRISEVNLPEHLLVEELSTRLLSSRAIENILQTAQGMKPSALKEALLRLARKSS